MICFISTEFIAFLLFGTAGRSDKVTGLNRTGPAPLKFAFKKEACAQALSGFFFDFTLFYFSYLLFARNSSSSSLVEGSTSSPSMTFCLISSTAVMISSGTFTLEPSVV